MVTLELHEAQLFRLLCTCFGNDRVIYGMSASAICDGDFPLEDEFEEDETSWVAEYKCLFAITDEAFKPKLVVDFVPGFTNLIDVIQVNKRNAAKSFLNARGIHYIGITEDEFSKMKNPDSNFDLYSLLELKVQTGDIALEEI